MWQRQQQVGSHMACAPFVNLVEWKVWKWHSRVCWTKITILYNFRNVYQTKDTSNLGQKVWKAFKFESSRRVIIVYLHIAVAKVLRKTLIAMWQTLSRSKLFSTRTLIIVPLSFLWMPWHQFELDVWSWLLASFRVRDTKYLSVGFIFRISEVDSSRLRFGLRRLERVFGCMRTSNQHQDARVSWMNQTKLTGS